ncbi:hypothetical protein Q1695_008460 [Nippostrongylus brasiliensis]|nr:hypothetical protein Q1695_008460 [Nippostrongylus brasiliensis]
MQRDIIPSRKFGSNPNPLYQKETSTRRHRLDLQGLRGMAILSVLGFHFFSKWFPNGYVGVDQFFVLSGYLMAMILDNEIGSLNICDFYYRRVKRIVPMYLLVILLILWSCFFLFPESNLDLNLKAVLPPLAFLSNLWHTEDESIEYFIELSEAENLFTHTWSLAVEMQFYLVVPSLTILCRKTSSCVYVTCLLIIGSLSLTFHLHSDTQSSFYHPLARSWQFLSDNAIRINNKFTVPTWKDHYNDLCEFVKGGPHWWCTFKDKNESASSSVLIIGNCWAANHAPVIHERCKHHAKSITLYSYPACDIVVEHQASYCNGTFDDYINFIAKMKPDYLFVIAKQIALPKKERELNSSEQDAYVEQIYARTQSLQNVVKKRTPRDVLKMRRRDHRLDLQGLRGVAILSVLGFHFFPSWFPNGYVGVDQFFVLSGFLMAMILNSRTVCTRRSEYFIEVGRLYYGKRRTFVEFICVLALVSGSLFPRPLGATTLRLATTITTAVVVAFGSNFLSSRCLVHFGDISYTLYLVHWPIFCWLKLNDHINRYDLTAGVMVAWLLSVLLTQTYERWYRAANKCTILVIVVILYALTGTTILQSGNLRAYIIEYDLSLNSKFTAEYPYNNISTDKGFHKETCCRFNPCFNSTACFFKFYVHF